MDLTNLRAVLAETFAANFVSYYRSHVAHVNTIGRNFYADHQLLGEIYEYFQGNIDTLGEKLRTVKGKMPNDLNTVLALSSVYDTPTIGDNLELLAMVEESTEQMIDQYHLLYEAAEEANYIDISNFAQDQIGHIAKFRWQLQSTLGMDEDEDEDEQRY